MHLYHIQNVARYDTRTNQSSNVPITSSDVQTLTYSQVKDMVRVKHQFYQTWLFNWLKAILDWLNKSTYQPSFQT